MRKLITVITMLVLHSDFNYNTTTMDNMHHLKKPIPIL
jgi:hypothetical protein